MRDAVGAKLKLGCRSRLHADRRASELRDARDPAIPADHESLPVVKRHRREIEAELSIARQGPDRIAREQVDLARLQGDEALLGRDRLERNLGSIAENGTRHRPAKIGVEAAPSAVAVRRAEARKAGVDAAIHDAARLDQRQGRLPGWHRRCLAGRRSLRGLAQEAIRTLKKIAPTARCQILMAPRTMPFRGNATLPVDADNAGNRARSNQSATGGMLPCSDAQGNPGRKSRRCCGSHAPAERCTLRRLRGFQALSERARCPARSSDCGP